MHVAAERLRGGQRLVGGVLERLVVVLGEKKRRSSEHSRVLELVDQFGDRADLDAGLAARRLDGLQHFSRGVTSTP